MHAYRMSTGGIVGPGARLDGVVLFGRAVSPASKRYPNGRIAVTTGISPVETIVEAGKYGLRVPPAEEGENDNV